MAKAQKSVVLELSEGEAEFILRSLRDDVSPDNDNHDGDEEAYESICEALDGVVG